jgi:hypothetical protein
LEINEVVLRHLFVRLPQALVEPILAHAKGENIQPQPAEEEAEPVGAGVE